MHMQVQSSFTDRMTTELITSALVVSAAAVSAAFLRSICGHDDHAPVDRAWIRTFSLEKYRPMLSMLSSADFDFLIAQNGYRAEIGKTLLAARRRSYLKYLQNLVYDYNRMQRAARELVSASANDRSDLALALLKSHLMFSVRALRIRSKLAMGLPLAAFDIEPLFNCLQQLHMRVEAHQGAW